MPFLLENLLHLYVASILTEVIENIRAQIQLKEYVNLQILLVDKTIVLLAINSDLIYDKC